MSESAASLTVMLVAGEPSGDALGGELMEALRRQMPQVQFVGVGGAAMGEHGLDSLFPLEDIAVMGLRDILADVRLAGFRRIMARIRQTAEFAVKNPPDVLVVIDSPEFTHRVARRVRRQLPDLPIVGYVAPSVWAWRRGRAKSMTRYLNHVMALLPFEPEVFAAAHGPPCSHVGHPAVQRSGSGDGGGFRRRHGIADESVLLAVLPGSRSGEVARLAGIFGEAAGELAEKIPALKIAVLQGGAVQNAVGDAVNAWPVPAVVAGEDEKHDLFAAADMALAASGTVSLELALADVPMVIAYRMDPVSAWIAARLLTVPSVVLVNLILDRPLVSEFLQSAATSQALAAALEQIVPGTGDNRNMRQGFEEFRRLMETSEPSADHAARIVLKLAQRPDTGT